MSTIFAFLHHLAAFTVVSAIAVEFVLLRGELSASVARRIVAADAVYGAAAGTLLVVGLLRVFFFEKGPTYYFSSHAFLIKLAVFVAVGLLSIVPTLEFLSWRKVLRLGQMPAPSAWKTALVRIILHAELVGMVVILLCAAAMARGGFG